MTRRPLLALASLALFFSACEPKESNAPDSAGAATGTAEAASGPQLGEPPATERVEVKDSYHGVEVTEHYRWLEDASDEKVEAWSDAQDAYARAYLDQLPGLTKLSDELEAIMGAKVQRHWDFTEKKGHLFAIRDAPPKQQPFLVELESFDSKEGRVVFDPEAFDPEGLTHIDWYRVSPDGETIAMSLSRAGSEVGDLHIIDRKTGEAVEAAIPRVNAGTAGGAVAWDPDSKGFFYTRYPRDGEQKPEEMSLHVRVYHHALGDDPKNDRYELGEGFPPIAEYDLDAEPETGRILCTVQYGDSGKFAHYLRDGKKKKWTQFSEFGDGKVQASFGATGELLIVTRKDAPRGELWRLKVEDVAKPERAVEVITEGEDTIVSSFWGAPTVVELDGVYYVLYQTGGPSELRAFDAKGSRIETKGMELLPTSSASSPTVLGDRLLYGNGSYVEPWGWYLYDFKAGKTTKSPLSNEPTADLSKVQVAREFATSKDGTKVPYNMLIPEGLERDGNNCTIVTGYGGYGINLSPGYRATLAPLLDRGCIWVVANLRGGSEYGDEWHEQGRLLVKQNVFDDLIAVLEALIANEYTSSEHLGMTGGSNGGLLMGAVLTQRPELTSAVVSRVGIYDMLRVELSPNGKFNIPEFGTVKDPEQFKALLGYSPLHHVRDDVSYPATLFTTGANDPRVDPMQSKKMTARMQAASGNDAPVLLRINSKGGHGGGAPLDERVAEAAHIDAFFLHALGVGVD
jgi:prolyl oligopeptidase